MEDAEFVHQSLPELDVDEIDLSVDLLGKTRWAPIVISEMTGGHECADGSNRELAAIAEAQGSLGSAARGRCAKRRARARRSTRGAGRPTTLLLENLGLVRSRELEMSRIVELTEAVGADALCIHLNLAMEALQLRRHGFPGPD